MQLQKTQVHASISPRNSAQLKMSAEDCANYGMLSKIGVHITKNFVEDTGKFHSYGMDDQQGLVTTPSIGVPVQFVQQWLPGFTNVITASRKIDELIGMVVAGSWEEYQVVFGVLETIGQAVPYGDYTNVPVSSWNVNFNYRNVIQFEKGFKLGVMQDARSSRMNVNSSSSLRNSAMLALEIQRNAIGFYGYNNGDNQTYGFLNDPNLPAYENVANGASGSPLWSEKTGQEMIADIISAYTQLQTQSQDVIDPKKVKITLALPTGYDNYLTTPSPLLNYTPMNWLNTNYPLTRVVTAPELLNANGGVSVFYLYAEEVDDGFSTDDRKTFIQVVPSKFMTLGVQRESKSYTEDFANATAGAILKRPYAVVRRSGI